jgi:hypothetical protein
MRRFYLDRKKDVAGVSGTGRVAEGCLFTNGKVAITWVGEHKTVTTHDNMQSVQDVHCHGGATRITWVDDEAPMDLMERAIKMAGQMNRKGDW